MEIVIGILTGGLVCMALLVVVLARNVLRRSQRPPDQALVSMVQDLVNVVLAAKQAPPPQWRFDGSNLTPEGAQAAMRIADEPEDATNDAMQVNHM